ncbi:MAG: DUF1993 domain-containing protein [Proteobacteria bacterium]|nr:DUF1993 domain-containing protein [Pseudomonadota bacterium]
MGSVYDNTIGVFTRSLTNLQKFLDKAQAYAEAKKFDVEVLVNARLAPDMYPLVKQIQVACDTAKSTAARLAGMEPPKHEDNEKTFAELKARVTKVLNYLETVKPADLEGAEDRRIPLPWAPGKWMQGGDYLSEMALPNFYFHLTTAYNILRHNGVDIGKMDYIGNVKIQG